jgi:hypothetical protein
MNSEQINPPESDLHSQPTKVTSNPSPIFAIRPDINSETLLVHAYETLASANVMATELSSNLTGPTCNMLLGIQQMIVLAQLSVNRVLDQLDPQP